MIRPEEFNSLPIEVRAKQYAQAVLATENNPEFLRLSGEIYGGPQDGQTEFTYSSRPGEYTYSFLAGGGCLGHPSKPTILGEAALKLAEFREAEVSFMDFTFPKFNKPLNEEVLIEVFIPILQSIGENPGGTERK